MIGPWNSLPFHRPILAEPNALPKLRSVVRLAMGKKRIVRNLEFVPLSRHHVYGVMQHHIRQFGSGVGHENSRLRLPPHQDRERADMILVSVRDEYRVKRTVRN